MSTPPQIVVAYGGVQVAGRGVAGLVQDVAIDSGRGGHAGRRTGSAQADMHYLVQAQDLHLIPNLLLERGAH
jgi:hypothetical protein